MKKILIAYGALVLLVIGLAVAKFNGLVFFSKSTATINNQSFNITLADNDKERQVGLSGKKSLNDKDGMLFVFDQPGKYSFWMKNTFIPLDIIYINEGKIVHIIKNAPPQKENTNNLPIYTPPTDAKHVLEINGGLSDRYQFKNGDNVIFSGVK